MTTTLPDWLIHTGEGLTMTEYEALPDEVRRRIEIIDGCVMLGREPRRGDRRIARRLANALEVVTRVRFAVDVAPDLRLRDPPLLMRRPDVAVYDASLQDDGYLRPEHCLLLVEVMSPDSVTTDQIDKPAEYAVSGIQHFWRVESDDQAINVFRYQLDPMTRTYALVGLDKSKLSIKDPIALELDLESLRR